MSEKTERIRKMYKECVYAGNPVEDTILHLLNELTASEARVRELEAQVLHADDMANTISNNLGYKLDAKFAYDLSQEYLKNRKTPYAELEQLQTALSVSEARLKKVQDKLKDILKHDQNCDCGADTGNGSQVDECYFHELYRITAESKGDV